MCVCLCECERVNLMNSVLPFIEKLKPLLSHLILKLKSDNKKIVLRSMKSDLETLILSEVSFSDINIQNVHKSTIYLSGITA